MLMALAVMVVFALLLVSAFDEGMPGKDKSFETVIAEQAKVIVDEQAKLDGVRTRLEVLPRLERVAKELETVKRDNQIRAGLLEKLAKDAAALQGQLTAQLGEFEDYKNTYRTAIRGRAKGLEMDELRTRDGKVFTAVKVTKVTAQAMHVKHADGITAIPYEVLSDDMRDLYQFDPAEKERFLADGRKATQVLLRSVEGSERKAKEQAEEERKARERTDKMQRYQDIATLRKRIASLERDIASLQQAIAFEKNKSLSHAPAMESRLRDMNNEKAGLLVKMTELEAHN
jgi:hypothetical protein